MQEQDELTPALPAQDGLTLRAHLYFERHLSVTLDDLLKPVEPLNPAGHSAKSAGVYHAIQGARREDDASLPQGPWQHELKRADWVAVSANALDTLRRKSKDLQVAAWLLEAQIHQGGFGGIAPCLVLIDALMLGYWDDLYPKRTGTDTTHRANVLRWINRKLLPLVRQVPITAAGQASDFTWADREGAQRHDAAPRVPGQGSHGGLGGPAHETRAQALAAAMTQTPAVRFQQMRAELQDALAAVARLTQTIDACFDGDAPSLSAFSGLLAQILLGVEAELHRRGLLAEVAPPAMPAALPAPAPDAPRVPMPVAAGAGDRAQAYALLEQAVQTLLVTDPHSPAPYLVRRAVEWGRLSTSDLYKEVFIRMGGQINIFELLGLEVPEAQTE